MLASLNKVIMHKRRCLGFATNDDEVVDDEAVY